MHIQDENDKINSFRRTSAKQDKAYPKRGMSFHYHSAVVLCIDCDFGYY